jgi:hypothetical protein
MHAIPKLADVADLTALRVAALHITCLNKYKPCSTLNGAIADHMPL